VHPIEHLIVAYVPIFCYALLKERRVPPLKLTGVIFIGSQFPDLIDKPLALQFNWIPTGRVFMHSLPFAVPIWIIVSGYTWKTDRPHVGVSFTFAYFSHLIADNYITLVAGRIPNDLIWPVLPPTPRPPVPYWVGPNSINLHLWTAFSTVVLVITTYYVIRDINLHLEC